MSREEVQQVFHTDVDSGKLLVWLYYRALTIAVSKEPKRRKE